MDIHRKEWNTGQQALRRALARPQEPSQAVDLFLRQHAMVHAACMAQAGLWSFEDEALDGVSAAQMRQVPPGCEHSLAWVLWHLTRIEDMTMNSLAAGSPQVFDQENWAGRSGAARRDTGNGMDMSAVAELSAALDGAALREYRQAVGRRTRQVVGSLDPQDWNRRVEPARLQELVGRGDVLATETGLLAYWGGLDVAGLLLMPPTRHAFVHWNEAARIRKRSGTPQRSRS